MPTIRDLVGAIRQREGVEAAVVLGRDGLLIDGHSVPDLDAEHVGRADDRRDVRGDVLRIGFGLYHAEEDVEALAALAKELN